MPVLDHITVISNLELRNAHTTGNHASSNCAFLSCSRAKRTEGSDYELGTTVDQIAARGIGRDTQIPRSRSAPISSPRWATATTAMPAHIRTILSWSSPTTPLRQS